MSRAALRELGEIASVIEFLLDGTNLSYMTGEIVAVDGGFSGAGFIADDRRGAQLARLRNDTRTALERVAAPHPDPLPASGERESRITAFGGGDKYRD